VTGRTRDVRDQQTKRVSRFINEALDDASKIAQIADMLLPDDTAPRLPVWPPPNLGANALALHAVRDAIPCIQRAVSERGLDHLPSRSSRVPEPRLELPAETPAQVVYRAPLVVACLHGDATYELAHLLVYCFSPHLRRWKRSNGIVSDLFAADDVRTNLMRRLNNYLTLESKLWSLARQGGFPGPVPYAVRYESARWLWSPAITGSVFCLRCGQDINYQRKKKKDRPRRARCTHCARGNPAAWPTHAIAPHDRGRWWLNCQHQGCSHAFIGRAQTKFCPEHPLRRITPNRRDTF